MPGAQNELSPRLQAILDGGMRVIARGGMRALTHRAVDAEAGIPEGSTSGYYRTRMALVVAISGRVGDLLQARVAELGQQLSSGVGVAVVGDRAVEVILAWLADSDLLMAQAELTTEAIRHPEIHEALVPYRSTVLTTVKAMMEHLGAPDPETYAMASLAAVEGVIATALSEPPAEREAFVRRVAPLVLSGFGTLRLETD